MAVSLFGHLASIPELQRPPYTARSGKWVWGVWYCGTAFKKVSIYGAYPKGFTDRVRMLFPTQKILHLCCGFAHMDNAVNVDINPENRPNVVADVEALPFSSRSFEVVLIDPPYTENDAMRYGVSRLLSSRKVMAQLEQILIPGGWLLWLDEKYPSYRRGKWNLRGLIAVITGFERRTRVLSMFQLNPNGNLFG